MKILITGGSGFIGRNIIPILSEKFEVVSPNRFELNLLNRIEIEKFILNEKIEVIIHCANPNHFKNKLDRFEYILEESLRIFLNIYQCRNLCSKIIYTGSGAEYDKSLPIVRAKEEDSKNKLPYDTYGFSKYIMNDYASNSQGIINFRIFGCYGPTDDKSKFITHCIQCCLNGKPITIRQDCLFDYMHVYDLARAFEWAIENNMLHKVYNLCSGERILLSEIAKKVVYHIGFDVPIHILKEGYNNEYTGDNSRWVNESGWKPIIDIDKGIREQIKYEKSRIRGEGY